ncbi:MAG: 5-deoxy-glucuronate isomerase [Chloroflexota bacterium]
MTQLKFQYHEQPGFTKVVSPENSVLDYVSLGILRQNTGDVAYHGNSGKEEVGLVILSGSASIRVGNCIWEHLGKRTSVYAGAATTIYVPPDTPYQIAAIDGPLELAITGARSERPGTPTLITPSQVWKHPRGVGNWERQISDLITHVNPISERLYLIEVITPPGNWSSVPPHKHDTDRPQVESQTEEIYYFKIDPPQGFGFQRIYTDDRQLDEAIVVENNTATIQPRGYHPVANHPGYQMYYLNVLAGEKRGMIQFDDPAHAWVKTLEPKFNTERA